MLYFINYLFVHIDIAYKLTKEERIEIVLMSGRDRTTHWLVAVEFNAMNPDRPSIVHRAVGRLFDHFKGLGNICDSIVVDFSPCSKVMSPK